MSAIVYGNLPGGAGGTGQTIGAVTVDLATLPMPSGARWKVTGHALGSEATPTTASLQVSQAALNNAGTVALIGALTTLASQIDAALTGALLTFVASAGNLILRATGVAAKTINWTGKIQIELTL